MLESHLPILKRLSPFAALNEADLEPIVAQGSFKTLDRGSMLFKRSSSDTHSHWLLSGRLNLINDAFENRVFTESDSQSLAQSMSSTPTECLLSASKPA